jgi:hypothetical protein
MNRERTIINNFKEKYKKNMAAILVYGTYNTGQFLKGTSDIDTIIILKRKLNLDLIKEREKMLNELSNINLSISHFTTLKDYKKHIYEKSSWSSWITLLCGSKIIYSTEELKNLKKYLSTNPIKKEKLISYVKHKDEFELDGYFKNLSGWDVTKGIFSHLRRKLQIMNYYKNKSIEFDYSRCLNNLPELKHLTKLIKINDLYNKRKLLRKREIPDYIKLAKHLTPEVLKAIK